MAEVSGLRNRNHFDSNCNTDRDKGKSAPSLGAGSTERRPREWRRRPGAFTPLFFLHFRRLFEERGVFSVSQTHLFRWQPRGVLPSAAPAAVTPRPPRKVSSAAWRPSKPRACLCLGARARCCCAPGSNPRHLSPQAAASTCLEDPRAPAVQAARGSTPAGSKLGKCPRWSALLPLHTHTHTRRC